MEPILNLIVKTLVGVPKEGLVGTRIVAFGPAPLVRLETQTAQVCNVAPAIKIGVNVRTHLLLKREFTLEGRSAATGELVFSDFLMTAHAEE